MRHVGEIHLGCLWQSLDVVDHQLQGAPTHPFALEAMVDHEPPQVVPGAFGLNAEQHEAGRSLSQVDGAHPRRIGIAVLGNGYRVRRDEATLVFCDFEVDDGAEILGSDLDETNLGSRGLHGRFLPGKGAAQTKPWRRAAPPVSG